MQGEVYIDQYLAQNLPTPIIPTLIVGFPEPSPLAFGIFAASSIAVWRRRVARITSR